MNWRIITLFLVLLLGTDALAGFCEPKNASTGFLGVSVSRARYYKPDIGRFWTMDSYGGNRQDPLSLHKYLYCHANPINGFDPSGNSMEMDLGFLSSTLIGQTLTTSFASDLAGYDYSGVQLKAKGRLEQHLQLIQTRRNLELEVALHIGGAPKDCTALVARLLIGEFGVYANEEALENFQQSLEKGRLVPDLETAIPEIERLTTLTAVESTSWGADGISEGAYLVYMPREQRHVVFAKVMAGGKRIMVDLQVGASRGGILVNEETGYRTDEGKRWSAIRFAPGPKTRFL